MAWGDLLSNFGSTFQALTFAYLAYATTGSALATAMVGIAFRVPFGLMAIPSGKIARRFDHRRVVTTMLLLKVAATALVTVVAFRGDLGIGYILAFTVLAGITSSVSLPNWKELLRQFSASGRLDETNALFSSLLSVAHVAGALAGGLALDTIGAGPLLAFNAVSYLPLAVVVARLPAPAQPAAALGPKSARTLVREAVRAIRSSPPVQRAVRYMVVLNLLAFPFVALLPKVAAQVGPSSRIYGLLLASFYVGGSLVAIVLGRWKKESTYSRIVLTSMGASGLALVLFAAVGFAPLATGATLASLAILLAGVGLALLATQAILGAITQLGVPKNVVGEVLSLYALTLLGFGSIGAAIQGFLADHLEVWWLPLGSGALILVLVAVAWLREGFRLLNEADPGLSGVAATSVQHAGNLGAQAGEPGQGFLPGILLHFRPSAGSGGAHRRGPGTPASAPESKTRPGDPDP